MDWFVLIIKLNFLLGLIMKDFILVGIIGYLFDFIILSMWLLIEILNGNKVFVFMIWNL